MSASRQPALFSHPMALKAREQVRRHHVEHLMRLTKTVPQSFGDQWLTIVKACDPKLTPTRSQFNAVMDTMFGRH